MEQEPDLTARKRKPRRPAPTPDSAEVVPALAPESQAHPVSEPASAAEAQTVTPPSAPVPAPQPQQQAAPVMATWEPPRVVKVTTQMSIEHRQLMDHLEKTTGKRMWELLGDAIQHTYGGRGL